MSQRSESFQLVASGDLAIFTRPELKAERVSYPVMTPAAARGLIEAVFWKPAIVWRIESIAVLNPIRWVAFRRNEVATKATAPSKAVIEDGGEAPVMLADENRSQRNTVALRDVRYLVTAHFELTKKAGPEENVRKFSEMFGRRLAKGQHFHQPYLGCREAVADVMPAEEGGDLTPSDVSQDLGLMHWDFDYSAGNAKPAQPRIFHAKLDRGVLHVPEDPESTLDWAGAPVGEAGGLG